MRPLTRDELTDRALRVVGSAVQAGGEPGEVLFGRIVCDGCGRSLDLLEGEFPQDWTTEGSAARGYVDLCARCSP
jgi:hypothetical protein